MFCASVAYPIQQGGTFGFDYFVTRHVPLFARLLRENCVKFEVQKHLEQPGAPKPTVLCTAYFWVTSGEAFGAALVEHGQEIYADIPNFTNMEPVRQWCEVVQAAASS